MRVNSTLTAQVAARCASGFGSLLLGVIVVSAATGQEFAVKNTVSRDDRVQNATRTIITSDAYYDVIYDGTKPVQVSVYFPQRQQYQLVNFIKKTHATIDETDVSVFVAKVLDKAKHSKNPIVAFAADPEFRKTVDSNTLNLESKPWSYTVQMQSVDAADAVDAYRKFADAFARLNAFWAYPPNARLQLNREIQMMRSVPTRVEVQLNDNKGRRLVAQATDHRFDWKLTPHDRNVIETTRRGIVDFKTIPFAKFHQAVPRVARKPALRKRNGV